MSKIVIIADDAVAFEAREKGAARIQWASKDTGKARIVFDDPVKALDFEDTLVEAGADYAYTGAGPREILGLT